jgi:WD40 repeat protein
MHTAPIRHIVSDRDGRWAVTVSDDKTARIWDIASAKQVGILRPPQDIGSEGKLLAAAISKDGAMVAVGGWTGWDWDRSASVYMFARESGRLVRRIPGFKMRITDLDFSPDTRHLAVAVGGAMPGGTSGVEIIDIASGTATAHDVYDKSTASARFSPDGRKLLTTCYDGKVRLYSFDAGRLRMMNATVAEPRARPHFARFSPDGGSIAVGYNETLAIRVFDAQTLTQLATPPLDGVEKGDLGVVAWTSDGRYLVAGGAWQVNGRRYLRRWRVNQWTLRDDIAVANNTITDINPLPNGGLLFASYEPAWGVIDVAGNLRWRKMSALADFRMQNDELRVANDGTRVRFGYRVRGDDPVSFDVKTRTLGEDDRELARARSQAPKLILSNWQDRADPSLNGQPLPLQPYERARSYAISPDGERLALGTDWYLRVFDASGKELWSRPAPDAAWAVNVSGDGRFVIVCYGDGTVRWHRLDSGRELLALFVHADRTSWVAWTPEGFFDASPDAESMFGYHLNHGKERAGEFVSVGQLRERFYQPGLIEHRLDDDGDKYLTAAVRALGDVRKLLAQADAPAPLVELVSPAESTGEGEVAITVRVVDRGGGIGSVNFYIDGKPEVGRQASVSGDNITRVFPLRPGRRQIEVAASNRAGVESPRILATVHITGAMQQSALHILSVGVAQYPRPLPTLSYSAHDAQVAADEIAARAQSLFKGGITKRVLLDHQATLSGIMRAFEEMKPKMRANDTLVIFLAGHGEAPIGTGYVFLPWDFRRGAAGEAGQGLNEPRLRALLTAGPANAVLFIDTCDAGGAVDLIKGAHQRLEGMSKRAVIGASRRGQLAKEGFRGHGIFTAALLQTFDKAPEGELDTTVDVDEISVDVKNLVEEISRSVSPSVQRVSSFLDADTDFPVVARRRLH